MKPNKENIVNEILIELEKGISYSECLVVNGSKWSLPSTTFTRYWKTANEKHAEKQELIKNELLVVSIDSEKEKLKKAILTKDSALELLTKIANEGDRDSDRINALKTMADLEGWKAPTKIEHAGEVKNTTTVKWGNNEIPI